MLYSLYVIGFSLAKFLPLRFCYAVAELIALGFYLFSKRDIAELKDNLRMVLGADTDEEALKKHVRAVFRNFSKYLVDFFKFQKFTEEYIKKHIEISGTEHLDEVLSSGKGALLVSLHLGSWELGAALLGGLKYPMNALVLSHKNKRINDFFVKQRGINDVRSIPVGAGIKECFKALKRKECLAIVGDKDYTSGGVYVDFFGKKALMPKGPAAFSIKTGTPIVFCALTRKKDDSLKFTFERPIIYEPTGDMEKDIRGLMSRYIKIFEKYIKEYPDQWYVFKRIWNPETITQ
jgi:KDO2-lipid IV(A) lauroyltransferase